MNIQIINNEGRAGTKIIADGFNRRHEQITRLVKKYESEFKEINTLSVVISKGKTKSINEYMLTEAQFMFLGSLLKNNAQVVRFKLNLVKEFEKVKSQLESALNQKHDARWNEARLTAKTLRLMETGTIQEFIVYAKKQGGSEKGCDRYYSNITRMTNGLLFICESKFKSLRDILTPEQLMIIGSAELVISKSIRDDMKNNVFYKDIYINVRNKVELFAELHGKSEVISKQIGLLDI